MTPLTPHSGNRRWTVRNGTTGTGADLFEVYAPTMEEARRSVVITAAASYDVSLSQLSERGFSVHTGDDVSRPARLGGNLWAYLPAPDYPFTPVVEKCPVCGLDI